MKKFSLIILFTISSLAGFSATGNSGIAADDRPLHEIHSMMIFNFIKYIQWPNNDASQEFVIGVLGDDEVYNTLKAWYDGKVRANKKITIKKYNSASDISASHIVYISNSASKEFAAVKSKVNSSSTLLITDKSGLGQKGSSINFKTVNGKLVFELNQGVIDSSNLKVSSQLTAMAIVI